MNTTERKYALLLRRKQQLEVERKRRADEKKEREERERLEYEKHSLNEEAQWELQVDALEVRKELLAEMVAVGDWDGLKRELSEMVVGGAISWSGPILIGSALLGLPLARELFLNWSGPVGVVVISGFTLFIGRKIWHYYYPSQEYLDEELFLLETELGINHLLPQHQQSAEPVQLSVAPAQSPIYHQPSITRAINPIQGGPLTRSILEVVMASHKPHFLYVGATRSGKTTLVRHTIKARSARGDTILICDPHNIKGSWGGHKVSGGGANWHEYLETLNYINDYMRTVLDQLNDGSITEKEVPLLTCYLGEWSWAAQEMDNEATRILATLIMGGAKAGIRLIIDAQSDRVESLGIRGRGDLRDSLARVRLSLRGRNGEKYTAHYDGQKVRSAGPFEGWGNVSEEVGSVVPRVPDDGNSLGTMETPKGTAEKEETVPNDEDYNEEIEVISDDEDVDSLSVLFGKTHNALFVMGENPTITDKLINATRNGETVKEKIELFKDKSGRKYQQRKYILDLVEKIVEVLDG